MMMKDKIGNIVDSVEKFFRGGGDNLTFWCDPQTIADMEKQVARNEKNGSEEEKRESIMKLSWALVHSKQSVDVKCGIAMLKASLATSGSNPLQTKERLYLMALGYYRSRDYTRSKQLLDQCLTIAPGYAQALTLKKAIEERIDRVEQRVMGVGIKAGAVGLIVGGLVVAVVALRPCNGISFGIKLKVY